MALRKIYIHKKKWLAGSSGFTLIEVIVVVAIMSLVISSSLFFTTSHLKHDLLLSQRRHLVNALQTARADAMNNVGQTPYGVALYPPGVNGYVIFAGSNYSNREQSTETIVLANYPVVLGSSTPPEIIFSQLSGNANFAGELVLYDQSSNSSTSIIINYEGKIGW